MVNTGVVFVQRYNPLTGITEITAADENYAYSQQIGHSAYADMLHDTERNEKYNTALKIAIERMHRNNKKAIVLDIGTGTGLLSLFAERNGADEVYACESFNPMSECALSVIKYNNANSKIKIIPKRSDELVIGDHGDMPHKANILVSEVFDTELLGEGAINTFNHAHTYLLEEDAIVIPNSANIIAVVFESDLVNNWHKLRNISIDGRKPCMIKIPELITNCPGLNAAIDVRLNELPITSFKQITSPQMVFSLDFSKGSLVEKEQKFKQLRCLIDGITHGIFMWWELSMLKDTSLIISCAPNWANNALNISWRTHWKQAIYYLPCIETVKKDEEINIITGHDDYSWYFKVGKEKRNVEKDENDHSCQCFIHYCSPARMSMFNDQRRWSKYEKVFSSVITSDTVCICFSENTLLGVYAGLLGAKEVYQLDRGKIVNHGFKLIIEENNLTSKIKWIRSLQEIPCMLNQASSIRPLLLADPYFEASSLPMHDVATLYYQCKYNHLLIEQVIPRKAVLYILPVHFDELWKIRAPVENVLDIKLQPFDELMQNAVKDCNEQMNAQSLWEYSCVALSQPIACMIFDFSCKISDKNKTEKGKMSFEINYTCNAVVAWVDWCLDETNSTVISTGPSEPVIIGEYIKWNMNSKQGVYFLYPPWNVTRQNCLHYSIIFFPDMGKFVYEFSVSS